MPAIRDGHDVADPGRRGRGRWWSLRRAGWTLASVVVVTGAVALVAPLFEHKDPLPVRPQPSAEPTCAGLGATSGDGFALAPHPVIPDPEGGPAPAAECVGWIIERDYPFGSVDADVNAVISKIVAENQQVAKPAGKEPAKPYVRIGVLMSMTSTATGALAPTEILHALQGAYTAQWQANRNIDREFLDPVPQFQLVLANEATDKSAWPAVVAGLGRLKGGEHPLVAVTGLGISVPETRAAAEELGKLGIPTVGAVITADDMVAPSMFKVSPSNKQYAEALKAYLDSLRTAKNGRQAVKTGYLIWDRNDRDNFVTTLKNALVETFEAQYQLTEHNGAFTGSKPPNKGTAGLFGEIVLDICATRPPPEVVFYAGRDRDLPALVAALNGRGRCQNPKVPLVVVTGATGLSITPAELDAANIGLLDASCTDTATWTKPDGAGTPQHFKKFEAAFGELGFPTDDLADGYAILHRDAVVAAAWAVRVDAADKSRGLNGAAPATPVPLGPVDTRNAIFGSANTPIPGASGAMFFRELPANNLWPSRKPVPVLRFGALVAGWPPAELYYTR